MKVSNHRLVLDDDTPLPFVASPNVGATIVPELLIIHSTAGQTAAGAIAWLTNPKARVSAHVVIGSDGAVTQLVPFNRRAFHVGPGTWRDHTSLDQLSIGIELDNPGRLKRAKGRWIASFKKEYPSEVVFMGRHKNSNEEYGWIHFPPSQLESAIQVATALLLQYAIKDVVGHDDVAPGRKWDPGPAFPMEKFRDAVIQRAKTASAH